MIQATKMQINEAFELMFIRNPNSKRSMKFIQKSLSGGIDEALADIENIMNNGSRNHRKFISYSDCTVFFGRYRKEIIHYYRYHSYDAFVSVCNNSELKGILQDTIARVLYANDTSVSNYQYISSVIWQEYIDTIINAMVSKLEKMK